MHTSVMAPRKDVETSGILAWNDLSCNHKSDLEDAELISRP